MEIVRFAVYTTLTVISLSLTFFLSELIAGDDEWGDTEGFLIIAPLIIVVLLGFFNESIKQIIGYPFIWAAVLTSLFYIESLFSPFEMPAEPDIVDLAHVSPFPYLLAIFGLVFGFFVTLLLIGYILGLIKRRVIK